MTIKQGWQVVTVDDGKDGMYRVCVTEAEVEQAKADFESNNYMVDVRPVRVSVTDGKWFKNRTMLADDNLRSLGKLGYMVTIRENPYNGRQDAYGEWEKCLEAGRNYLVGRDWSMQEFVRKHTSPLADWQVLARDWCVANPDKMLDIEANASRFGRGRRFQWHVMKRGEYVELGLPYHDAGGERHYVAKDNGRTKVLVNVD